MNPCRCAAVAGLALLLALAGAGGAARTACAEMPGSGEGLGALPGAPPAADRSPAGASLDRPDPFGKAPGALENTTTALAEDLAGEQDRWQPGEDGNTLAAEGQYTANQPWQDFEVHLFVTLPFAALYSYLTVLSLDGVVQNRFPPELRQADVWVIVGLAAGSAFAVALGSIGRVPDQTVPAVFTKFETRPDPERPPGCGMEIASLRLRF